MTVVPNANNAPKHPKNVPNVKQVNTQIITHVPGKYKETKGDCKNCKTCTGHLESNCLKN